MTPRLDRQIDRDTVVAMLARFGDRRPAEVPEELGSLELTWLVDQVERRYGVVLDLDDEVFAGMSTVTGAVGVLRDSLGPAGSGGDAVPGAARG
jgi:hypothetical protein